MQRVRRQELLDLDSGSQREIASALCSIAQVNRLFGGNAMHRRLLSRVAKQASKRDLHILEAACGHASVLQAAAFALLPSVPGLRLTLLDRSAHHFPSPSRWSKKLPLPARITADALAVPLPDNSVDVVSCCLFLHHLSETEVRRFLAESLRLARVAVVVNDLERTPLHFALAKIFSLVDPSRISRHDGPASVAQAFTRPELASLLLATEHRYEIRSGYLLRLGAIVWK